QAVDQSSHLCSSSLLKNFFYFQLNLQVFSFFHDPFILFIEFLPFLSFFRFICFHSKRICRQLSHLLHRSYFSCPIQLSQKISVQSSIGHSCQNRASEGVADQLHQKLISGTAADHIDLPEI